MDKEKGQVLLELILAVAIVAIIIFLVSQLTFVSLRGQKSGGEQATATRLGQEEVEIARSIYASSWTDLFNFSKGADYFASRQVSPVRFIFATGQETVSIGGVNFIRKVQFFNVCRDSTTGNIINFTSSATCSLGIIDPSTQQIDLNVSWATGASVFWSEYFTRSLSNQVCQQSDWQLGADTAAVQNNPSACAAWQKFNSSTNINFNGVAGQIKIQ